MLLKQLFNLKEGKKWGQGRVLLIEKKYPFHKWGETNLLLGFFCDFFRNVIFLSISL